MSFDFERRWQHSLAAYAEAHAEYHRASVLLRDAVSASFGDFAALIEKEERAHTRVCSARQVLFELMSIDRSDTEDVDEASPSGQEIGEGVGGTWHSRYDAALQRFEQAHHVIAERVAARAMPSRQELVAERNARAQVLAARRMLLVTLRDQPH